jgi:hypothetical protein
MNNKHIVVFLKNKLISLDSILPLALEINRCCNYRFYFIIWQYESYKSVVEDNVVLRDMALSVGQIICPNISSKNSLKAKFKKFFMLASVVYKCYLEKSYVFHFGALDEPPLVLLAKLIKKNRVARCEASFTGRYTEDLTHQMGLNNENDRNSILQHRSSQKDFDRYIGNKHPDNRSGILIGFDPDWNWFKHPDAKFCKKLVFNGARNSEEYLNFISKNSDSYLIQEKLFSLDKRKTIVIILGHFGDGSKSSKYRNKLLYEVLTALRDIELNIIMKPHVFCDMDLVRSIVKKSKYKSDRVYCTRIHPHILQKISIGGLFINNSSVRCDYKCTNFPVITYNGGVEDEVVLDSCSGIVCADKRQLINSLELLMKKPEKSMPKEGKELINSCEKIENLFN